MYILINKRELYHITNTYVTCYIIIPCVTFSLFYDTFRLYNIKLKAKYPAFIVF